MKLLRKMACLLLFALMALPIIADNQSTQQTRVITGTVLDENAEPTIGASVTIPKTTIGVSTDINGAFSLKNVPANQKTIQVSYLGYTTQTIDITGKTVINVKLSLSDSELEEVIVVGYGVQKKAHLTGSISTISPKEIGDLSATSLGATLTGLVPGLSVSGGDSRPGSTTSLTVRQSSVPSAFSSVSGFVPNTGPLYVIDGFVQESTNGETNFNNLDGNMIESITVLKDASAAVYGARAGQGVILVTTKRGQIGAPKISYSGQFGYTDEVARAKMLNANSYGTIWNAVRAADPSDPWNNKTDLYQADELAAMKQLNYDLLEREWSSAMTQKHSINMSGGTDRANYFAGGSYITQDGNLGKIDYDRWNYRAGVDAKISNSLKGSLQVSGDYGDQRTAYSKVGGTTGDNDYNYLLTHPRYMPDYVGNRPIPTYGITNSGKEDAKLYNFNTIQNLDNYSKTRTQNMSINGSLEYDFGWSPLLKGLKLKGTYSKNIATTQGNQYATNYTLYPMIERGGTGNHLYTGDNVDLSDGNFSSISVTNGNSIRRATSRGDGYQMNFTVTYARKFGLHNVSGLFTIEKSENESEDLEGEVLDPSPYTNQQSNGATGAQSTKFSRTESGWLSYVGRVNYMYKDKYLAEFLVRSDASTNFAPENYWALFPSLSLGWILSEESWFKNNVQGISFFKVRGSLGLTGSDNIKPWQWMQTYGLNTDKGPIFGTGTSTPSGSHISLPDVAVNRDSHWTKNYKSNIGIDLHTLQDRLSVTLDGYYEWNRDIFMTRQGSASYPSTVGTAAAPENYGSINTYGTELSLGWKDKIGKDFKYTVKLNTGYSDNRVLEAPWQALIPFDDVHPGQRADVGQWGYECIGMFRSYQDIEEYFAKYDIKSYMGKTKDNIYPGMLIYNNIRGSQKSDGSYYGPNDAADSKAGYVDANDKVLISNRNNPYGVTVNLGGEWKNFSFSMQVGANWGGYSFVPSDARAIKSLVSTVTGYDVMQYTNLPSFYANNMFVYQDVLDAAGNVVSAQNLDAKYPNLRFAMNGEQSTFWKVSGTRATLRNITLAYSLPKELIKKIGVESCRLNVTAQNLLSLYNPYPDNFMDPLAGTYGRYPNLRKITLGVNVSF